MALVCLLLGCTKQCGFRFRSNDTPALKQGDYNSCEAINRNYCYLVCGSHSEVDYPYWANDGDTIMVCGYFYKDWHGDRNHFLFMTLQTISINLASKYSRPRECCQRKSTYPKNVTSKAACLSSCCKIVLEVLLNRKSMAFMMYVLNKNRIL